MSSCRKIYKALTNPNVKNEMVESLYRPIVLFTTCVSIYYGIVEQYPYSVIGLASISPGGIFITGAGIFQVASNYFQQEEEQVQRFNPNRFSIRRYHFETKPEFKLDDVEQMEPERDINKPKTSVYIPGRGM